MVKLGVFSDTHVGRTIPKAISDLRRRAFRHAFSQAIDIFIEEKVDYVIHAGDVFEKRSMTPDDSVFVKEEFQRLVDGLNKDVKIFVVRGNHDGTLGNSALDYVEHPLAKYFKILGERTLGGEPEIYEDGNVAVVGFGYTPYTSIKLEATEDAIKNSFNLCRAPHKIFIIHSFVEGHQDIPPGVPSHQIVSVDVIKGLGADIVICGHHHKYTPLTIMDRVSLLTPGATEAIELSDESSHGVCIVELGESVNCEFKPIKPLYKVKNVVVNGGEAIRHEDWFVQQVLGEVKSYIEYLRGEEADGVLRVVLEGVVEGSKYELEASLEARIKELKTGSSPLLYVAIENRLRERGIAIEVGGVISRDEFLAEVFKSLDESARAKATALVEEIDITLDEEASSKTGLLTDARRREFIEKWLKILEAEG